MYVLPYCYCCPNRILLGEAMYQGASSLYHLSPPGLTMIDDAAAHRLEAMAGSTRYAQLGIGRHAHTDCRGPTIQAPGCPWRRDRQTVQYARILLGVFETSCPQTGMSDTQWVAPRCALTIPKCPRMPRPSHWLLAWPRFRLFKFVVGWSMTSIFAKSRIVLTPPLSVLFHALHRIVWGTWLLLVNKPTNSNGRQLQRPYQVT